MYKLIRPLLFAMDAEKAHDVALSALNWLPSSIFPKPACSPVQVMGLSFSHRIGLAAGLDKNGDYVDALAKLGFSFIEVGTVTPRAQTGNPKPRLFRISEAGAIINRMGFNNLGVDALIDNIQKANFDGILGINIGKNKTTSLHQAAEDYLYCLDKVYPYASYITVNISSPNTPDLRLLQQKAYFENLLSQLSEQQKKMEERFQRHVPLLVKLSPDENETTLREMADVILRYGIEGIIAANTTCSHEAVNQFAHGKEKGGLSGCPLLERSTHSLKILKERVADKVALIGVGGVDSKEAAQQKFNAGASLIQIYSGLIYKGPALINELSTF